MTAGETFHARLRKVCLKTIRRRPEPGEYDHLTYLQASQQARYLIAAANEAGAWFNLPEHLVALRGRMERRWECSDVS